jgi:hypothetical protein
MTKKNGGELLSVILCRRDIVIRPFSIPLPTERHFRPLTLVCSRDPSTGKVKQLPGYAMQIPGYWPFLELLPSGLEHIASFDV